MSEELTPIEQIEPGAVVRIPREFLTKYGIKDTEGYFVGTCDSLMPNVELENGQVFPIEDQSLRVLKSKSTRLDSFKNHNRYLTLAGYSSGSDPEVFVLKGDGSVFPARGFLPEKKRGIPSGRGICFYDGLQAEFSISPQGCLEGLHEGTRLGLMEVLRQARFKDPKAKLTIQNSVRLSPEQMKSLSDEDVSFRCSTSLNIYGDAGDQPGARDYFWRFAGGHIHVGCRKQPEPVIKAVVRALDGVLGVAGVSLAASIDNSERRKMYGRAGEFRLPSHGLEYRVLSNYWLCSPLIAHLTFELMRWAFAFGEKGYFPVWEGEEEEIRDIINWCDVKGARKMLKRNKGIIEHFMNSTRSQGWDTAHKNLALKTILNGVEVVVPNPDDIEGNWFLSPEKQGFWVSYGGGANQKWNRINL